MKMFFESTFQLSCFHFSEIKVNPPPCEGPPVYWWDTAADKSLMVGTYRYGYEQ